MGKTINIFYDSLSRKTSISSDDVVFNTERIEGIDISKWIYPFHSNGITWYGLYEELKSAYMLNRFTILFEGDTDKYEILKNALKDKSVDVKEKFSKVIILYDDSQFLTKITINGKIFDTQRIEKRSIDEWVKPFSFKAANWQGIFGEIESYLGNDFYSISFVGKQEDMKILMENAPDNISIFYKPKAVSKKTSQSQTQSMKNNGQTQGKAPSSAESAPFSKLTPNSIKGNANGLISGAKIEFAEMNNREPGILLFGKIAVITAAICCIVFTIFMSRFLMILSIIPAIVFCVLSFTKGYKKLAICTFAAVMILAVISWIIVTIRWHMAFKDIGDSFDDFNDTLDDVNDMMKEANDALSDVNDAMAGN